MSATRRTAMAPGRWSRFAAAACLGVASVGAAAQFALLLMDRSAIADGWSAESLPHDRGAGWYAAVGTDAAERGAWDLAAAAARLEVTQQDAPVAAWHRLALAETQLAGQPNRETLRALLTAYETAPYPTPTEMKWRVEFAAAHWAFMPDIVQEKTLTQIEALGGVGHSWRLREIWCQTLPVETLSVASCKTFKGKKTSDAG